MDDVWRDEYEPARTDAGELAGQLEGQLAFEHPKAIGVLAVYVGPGSALPRPVARLGERELLVVRLEVNEPVRAVVDGLPLSGTKQQRLHRRNYAYRCGAGHAIPSFGPDEAAASLSSFSSPEGTGGQGPKGRTEATATGCALRREPR